MTRLPLLLAVFLTACGGGPGLERQGDQHAAAGRWSEALTAYSGAGDSPELLSKRATAALEAGQLEAASVIYPRLAAADRERAGEAAAGLARTAMLAELTDNQVAMANAVIGLREVAPNWPAGRLALPLRLSDDPHPEDVLLLGPAMLAAAPRGEAANRILLNLGRASRQSRFCGEAISLLGALIDRSEEQLAAQAREERARCELDLGLAALGLDDMVSAENYLDAALSDDPEGSSGRRARVGLGDIYLKRGDLFGASLAWQAVAAAPVESDSITSMALGRLGSIPSPETGDTSIFP